jgi:alanine racemase
VRLGRDGEDEITLKEMTEQCGTIEYEILTGLSPRLPRISVESG